MEGYAQQVEDRKNGCRDEAEETRLESFGKQYAVSSRSTLNDKSILKCDSFAQLIEEQQKANRDQNSGREAKKIANAGRALQRRSDPPPPPYQSASYDETRADPEKRERKQKRASGRASGTKSEEQAQTSWLKKGAMTITGAGIGGLTTLGAVTLLASVTGVAAVAGVTVYGLIAVGSVGAGAMGWASS